MFGRRKEQEGVREPEPKPDYRWHPAKWDGYNGWVKRAEDSDNWVFSITLPEEADPDSVKLAYSETYHDDDQYGVYTVSYRIKGLNFWKLIEISDTTEKYNVINEFSAHFEEDFINGVGFNNISRMVLTNL